MSNKKQVSKIILAFIAAILSASIIWQVSKADTPTTIRMVHLPGPIVTSNDGIQYSDVLAQQYAAKNSNWAIDGVEAAEYSDALALEYASRFMNNAEETNALYSSWNFAEADETNAPVSSWNFAEADAFDYSNALALEYASRFTNEDNTNQRFSWNFEDADAFAYSDALALQYAEKNSK